MALTYSKKPEPQHADEAMSRPCLMCRKPFMSSWPGERICPHCKTKTVWRDGTTPRDEYQ